MADVKLQDVVSQAATLAAGRATEGSPDQELLTRFVVHKDEGAFAALLERHGAMVLGVCRRVLRRAHDAEDACQAVFLVLARKAVMVRKRGSLGSWLHGVAWRVARKLQAQLARRRVREDEKAASQPAMSEPADVSLREACRILDEELNRLPAVYKAPLVLCHLEGRTQDEAARELGWTLGMLRGRLERGRERLRLRLVRRGVTGAAAVLAATALGATASAAAVPATLVVETVKISLAMATAKAVPATVSPTVAGLAQQALHGLFIAKMQIVALLCTSVAAVGLIAMNVVTFEDNEPAPPGPPAAETRKLEVWSRIRELTVPKQHIWSVAFSPDGKWLAAGSGGFLPSPGKLTLWNAASGKLLYALDTPRSVRCVTFAPDGKTLATAEHDGIIRLRETETGKVLRAFGRRRPPLDNKPLARWAPRGLPGRGENLVIFVGGGNSDCVVFSPDGKSLAASNWNGAVNIWDIATGQEVRSLAAHTGVLFAVAYGRDGTLASASTDGRIKIWDAGSGKARFILRHQSTVGWLAASGDGKLASASWDKTVKLWQPTTGKLLATLYGHSAAVLGLAFSPDDKTLASSSGIWGRGPENDGPGPGEVILWDLPGQKAVARIPFTDRVFGLAFSPHGNMLASGCWDGTVTLWKLDAANKKEEKTDRPVQESPGDAGLKFTPTARPAGQVTEPDPARNYPEEYHRSLKGTAEENPGVALYGPDAPQCVKFEPEGLRITLPTGYPRKRPGTGLVTEFGIKGDFEITMAFEVIRGPDPAPGRKVELSLVVAPYDPARPRVSSKVNKNWAGLTRQTMWTDHLFLAQSTRWNEEAVRDKWGNEIFANKEQITVNEFPTEATRGRLRLARRGSMLFFYASEGDANEFKLMDQQEFGTKDVKSVRLLGSTGGPGASFDVRVSDLSIRAEGLPKKPATILDSPGATRWLTSPFFLAPAIGLPLGVALGACYYVRRRRHSANPAVVSSLTFPCSSCGRRLKARAQLIGKTVKCPGCGKAIEVPSEQPMKTENQS